MQGMEIYGAAGGIVNRIRQQVINIHDHGQDHDQPGLFPSNPKEDNSD